MHSLRLLSMELFAEFSPVLLQKAIVLIWAVNNRQLFTNTLNIRRLNSALISSNRLALTRINST